MTAGRSSADPLLLARYASTGLEMVAALRAVAERVAAACDTLCPGTSEQVPALGQCDAALRDLVNDWEHLDTFAGEIADRFAAAGSYVITTPTGSRETVTLTLPDRTILQRGGPGYADRDEAVRAARALATAVERLRGATPDEDDVDDLAAQARRGMHDPVTLVEALGIAGLVDVVAMLESPMAGGAEYQDADWALAHLLPFATVLTTALRTRVGIPAGRAPGVRHTRFAGADRLSAHVVVELVRGFGPDGSVAHADDEFRLSVLLRQVDPPAEVAVALADRRMVPALERARTGPLQWADALADTATNYAVMLARDPVASARWFDPGEGGRPGGSPSGSPANLRLVLGRQADHWADGGAAAAAMVEHGVTTPAAGRRRRIMQGAIRIVGGELDEIRTPPLRRALAAGVEQNMDLIADNAIGVVRPQLDHRGTPARAVDSAGTVHDTHDLLREVLREDHAAARVYAATLEHTHEQLATVGPDGEGVARAAQRTGAVTSLVTEADINAEVGEVEHRVARRQAYLDRLGRIVDTATDLVPGTGAAGAGTAVAGWGAAEVLAGFEDTTSVPDAYDEATDHRKRTRDMVSMALVNRWYATSDVTPPEVIAAAEEALGPAVAAADTDFFVDAPDRPAGAKPPIKRIGDMSDSEWQAYAAWVNSSAVLDHTLPARDAVGQAADDVRSLVEGRR